MPYRNASGYPDPTAGAVIPTLARKQRLATKGYRPLVYITLPVTQNIAKDIELAKKFCRFAMEQGCVPFAPVLHYPQLLDKSDDGWYHLCHYFGLVLLGRCDELWSFGYIVSEGMEWEMHKAERRRMPIRYFDNDCKVIEGEPDDKGGSTP